MNHEIDSSKEFEEVKSHLAATRKQTEDEMGSLIAQARQVYRQLASYPSLTKAADLRAKHITIVNEINELKHQLSVAKIRKTDAKRRLDL